MSVSNLALRAVAQYRSVPINALRGPIRSRHFAWARQEACWLMRNRTSLSFPVIGRFLGNRDHTTIRSSVHAVDRRADGDPVYRRELDALLTIYEQLQPSELTQRAEDPVTGRAMRLLAATETSGDPDAPHIAAALLSIASVIGSRNLTDREARISIRSILSGTGVISYA